MALEYWIGLRNPYLQYGFLQWERFALLNFALQNQDQG
jgi:hypothetical protein